METSMLTGCRTEQERAWISLPFLPFLSLFKFLPGAQSFLKVFPQQAASFLPWFLRFATFLMRCLGTQSWEHTPNGWGKTRTKPRPARQTDVQTETHRWDPQPNISSDIFSFTFSLGGWLSEQPFCSDTLSYPNLLLTGKNLPSVLSYL